ncbi:flagellar hook-associated protein FlgK [Nitratiruptor sp. SB155-2]|uniref:flagellar hook-associated protein FlgK n=1 Tax=Nitratiruptor sp. (strain SB155-2) TaxID=387092 RepID=UPI0001586E14|nr:flagellar basal body rod C-terminal domain-containing protein [Nitratiruptor sp. SB155-2]BAF69759.1 flagellar hook-associated protein 1 FliK [Nitratiruptor sp. SB155-2]
MANTSVLQSAMANALNNISQTLLQNQKAIDIVNNNIANLNTEGYSRVEAGFSSLPTGGTLLSEAKRVFDKNYFVRMINTNQEKSYYENLNSTLNQLESLFKDSLGGGFSKQIDEFYNSLNDVISSPDDLVARKSFLTTAKMLVGRVRSVSEGMNDLGGLVKNSFRETVMQINNLARRITDLNKNIKYFANDQTKLNSYLDQRDQAIKKLSSLIDIKVLYHQNNTVDISTAKGHMLVLQDKATPIQTRTNKITMVNSYAVAPANTLSSPKDVITDPGTLTINYKLDGKDKSFSVDYQNRSLLDIAAEINSQSDDLKANVVNVGDQTNPDYRLTISTTMQNVQNEIVSIEDSDANDTTGFDINNSNEIYKQNYATLRVLSGSVDLTNLFQYGKIASLIKSQSLINQALYNVNRFTQDFAYQINSVHRNGYNLDNETGLDLFISEQSGNGLGVDATNIRLNFEDPEKLAAGTKQNMPADNTLAKAIEKTKDGTISYFDSATNSLQEYEQPDFLDGLTYNDFYNSKIVSDIAFEAEYTKDRLDDTTLLFNTLNEKIEDISGVNLDEELVKLTQLQRSYQATARVMMVTDELFKTLIEMTR